MERHLEIVTTEDGSTTVYVPDLEEHYHSIHGAIRESMHVFIQNGLLASGCRDAKIFEMGFGTGLNALLTCLEAPRRDIKIHYDGIEAFPLDADLVQELNFAKFLPGPAHDVFHAIHACEWERSHSMNKNFSIRKIKGDIQSFSPSDRYDLIYFDAFNPRVQPELWSLEIFRKMHGMLRPGGILTTYSASGMVRRNMRDAGLHVEKRHGPPGKREMLLATRSR